MKMKTVSGNASLLLLWGSLCLSVLQFLPLIGAQGGLNCSFQGEPLSLLNDQMMLQHGVNLQDGTITVEVVYNNIGWVAIGTNPSGLMIGGQVVIALPEDAPSSTNPGKYSLVSKSDPVQSLAPTSQQTLMNASFEQSNGQTILRFTKFLNESNEYPIDPSGSNTFIFAAGTDNTFGYHGSNRGSTTLTSLKTCGSTDTSVTAAPAIAPADAPVIAPVIAPAGAPVIAPFIAPAGAPVIAPAGGAPVIAPVVAPAGAQTAAPAAAPVGAQTAAPVGASVGVPTAPPAAKSASPSTSSPTAADVPTTSAAPVGEQQQVPSPTSKPTSSNSGSSYTYYTSNSMGLTDAMIIFTTVVLAASGVLLLG